MVAGRPAMVRHVSRYHDDGDDVMSPRSTQSGLTKFGIETSHSTHHVGQQPPLSPLDKAKMQWKRHKNRIQAETEASAPCVQPEQELRAEASRSRSVSPERMPMYGDRARGDHRSFGLVGEPIEAVKLRPVPKSQRLVRRSKSSSRSSRYSRSNRRSRSSRSSRYIDAREDAGCRSRDDSANSDQHDSGCSNLIEDFAVRASQSFEDISKSFEEAEQKRWQAIDALSTEIRKSMPSPPTEATCASGATTSGTENVTLAESFASNERDQSTPAPALKATFPSMGSIFCGIDALCTPLLAKTETTSLDVSTGKVQEDVAGTKEVEKPSTSNLMSCAGRCAATDGIVSENTFSLDGLAALSSDDEAGPNTQGDQLLILRETFSNLSSSLPEVGWKINVDANNQRLVQQRTNIIGRDLKPTADGTYRVVILDDRKGSSNPPIKVAVVERDPALLSRCHFAGWDGKQSHFTVLTPPPTANTDSGSKVLQKLKEVPGTLTFTNPLSPSSEYSKMPKWMQPEVKSQCEGVDAVIHLVIGPEPPAEAKSDADSDEKVPDTGEQNGDEEKMLNKIVSGWSALSFSEEEDDGEDEGDEEESYAPSTVGAVEGQLLRNFLGSADWCEEEEEEEEEEETGTALPVEPKPTKQVEGSPKAPVGKPPLAKMPPSQSQMAHQRENTATSRASTGSCHRRSNSIGVFTGDQLAHIMSPKLAGTKTNPQTQLALQTMKPKAHHESRNTTKSKFRPPLPIPGRMRQKKGNKGGNKAKLGIWRKRTLAEVPSATGSSVGSSAIERSAEPLRRENSIILKASGSFDKGLVHSPQFFFRKCPMFRRALRSMGYCGKRERPRLEGWCAFSKGSDLQTLGNTDRICRDDFRYIVLTTSGSIPTIHIMSSKKDSSGPSVDGVEHLVLKRHMRIMSSDSFNGSGRCLSIVDSRNGKVIGTLMPVLINGDVFTDGSRSCLVSERRFEKIVSELESNCDGSSAAAFGLDDGQLDAANHALFVLDCEMKKQ